MFNLLHLNLYSETICADCKEQSKSFSQSYKIYKVTKNKHVIHELVCKDKMLICMECLF